MTKAKDYSETAEKLCNPPEIGAKLKELKCIQGEINILKSDLENNELYRILQEKISAGVELTALIRGMIDTQGSYQDTENKYYAVKFRRTSRSYDPETFKTNFPKFTGAVIEESVNVEALEGLIKGKLITEEELKETKVTIESYSYAYYIH